METLTFDPLSPSGLLVIGKTVAWDSASRIASIADLADTALSATNGCDGLDGLTLANKGASAIQGQAVSASRPRNLFCRHHGPTHFQVRIGMNETEIVAKADAAIEVEEYSMAVALLKPLVDRDNPKAMNSMGLLSQHGLGVPRDIQTAIALFERAATLGDGYAAHNLGTLYAIAGADGHPEPELSRRWYLRARELGALVAPESWYESLRQQDNNH